MHFLDPCEKESEIICILVLKKRFDIIIIAMKFYKEKIINNYLLFKGD